MNPARLTIRILAMTIVFGTTGCATTADLNTTGVDKTITPQFAKNDIKFATNKRVLWGGMIMSTKNLPQKTEIEVLAFPLDDQNRPEAQATATTRFIADHTGYLEPVDYARGRWVTLTGVVQGARAGKVGEAPYDFPVVQTDGLYLWPKDSAGGGSGTQFQFGIGIGVYK